MTGHLRGDARKRATDAHQIHHDPAVRDLIERERRAAAVAALREMVIEVAAQAACSCEMCDTYMEAARIIRDRADRIERGGA